MSLYRVETHYQPKSSSREHSYTKHLNALAVEVAASISREYGVDCKPVEIQCFCMECKRRDK